MTSEAVPPEIREMALHNSFQGLEAFQELLIEGQAAGQVVEGNAAELAALYFACIGGIAHRMYALFKENGLTDVQVEPLTRVTTDYETFRPAALERAIQTGRFFHSMSSFITSGRKHL
jgi:hypothetical protein